jgi:hypothetical protein
MQQLGIQYRNAIAILFGIGLGYVAGRVAFFGESATFVLLFSGFIVTPIPVCFIAARRWVWLSVIPVLASQVTLLTLSYRYAYKPDGTDLQGYLHTRIYPHWLGWLLWWIPAIVMAAIFYAIKPRTLHQDV